MRLSDTLNLMVQFSLRFLHSLGAFPLYFENQANFLRLVAFDEKTLIAFDEHLVY